MYWIEEHIFNPYVTQISQKYEMKYKLDTSGMKLWKFLCNADFCFMK